MIEFHHLGKTWPDGTRALSEVSLQVPRGQFCVVLGPSGAGKSTLLRAVNGLMRPTEGRLMIDGVEFNAEDEKNKAVFATLRSLAAYVAERRAARDHALLAVVSGDDQAAVDQRNTGKYSYKTFYDTDIKMSATSVFGLYFHVVNCVACMRAWPLRG